MNAAELAGRYAERFGDAVSAEESYGQLTIDVPPAEWAAALAFARDDLDCDFFDWLTAVDQLDDGFDIVAHVWSQAAHHHVLVRTRIPRDNARLPTATGVYRGANWHERETYEMFGVEFDGHPNLIPLLLPDGFEGHPLRKEFVLVARAAKAWPGAKEPGESDHEVAAAPARRRTTPPGVPDAASWGPRPPGQPAPEPGAPQPPAPRASARGTAVPRVRRTSPPKDAAGEPESGGDA